MTVVVTDVVDAARLWQETPDAMARHEEIVTTAVASHSGVVLRTHGPAGEAVAVFANAVDAVHAAHAARVGTPVSMRAGIDTGEPVERERDYLGSVVTRAGQLRNLANGAGVVVSPAVADLVGELPVGTIVAGPQGMAMSVLDERGVTQREAEVLEALGLRLTNAEIAARLYVSERTVESHVSALLRKLGAANRLELGEFAKDVAASAALGRPQLPAPLALLADSGRYVGRTAERTRLRYLWQRVCAGPMAVALVTGEAGIGKSRLIAELAAEVHTSGGGVLAGSCFEDVPVPYQPFVQAIADDAARLSDDELRRRLGSGSVLGRIMPELATRLGLTVDGAVLDTASERADVFAALYRYLSRAADGGPVLCVLEDLHWSTTTTRDALRHLARVGGHAPVLVVVTARDTAPDLDATLAAFLADLASLPAVEHVRLGGLDQSEVAELVDAIGGMGDPSALAADTGGNPLLVREVATGSDRRTGQSLPALLARRSARLDEDDNALLDVAAVLGAEFDADLLAASGDRRLTDVLESLERAEAAGLVAAAPGRPGRFTFLHALFRAARYDALPLRRRWQLHQQVAWALQPRSEDDRVIPELARHACIAAPLGEARTALAYARRAGDLAERALALDEAADHYRQALAVADLVDPPEVKLRLRLAIRLGELLNGAGNPEHRRVLLDAAAVARAAGDGQALADIAWALVHFGFTLTAGTSDPEFVEIAEAALMRLGPEPTAARARTLAALSADLSVGGAPGQAFAYAQEALAIARQLDDPVTLAHVLLAYRFSAHTPDNDESRHPAADQLMAIGRQTGQPVLTIIGLHHRAWSFREEGDLVASDAALDAAEQLLGEHRVPQSITGAGYVAFKAARQLMAGDLAGAERTASTVLELAGSRGFDATNWYGPAIISIRHKQGRLAELIPMIEAAIGQPGVDDAYSAALAVAMAHGGRIDEAAAIVRQFADDDFAAIKNNLFWLTGMVVLCEAAEMTGDAAAGESLALRLGPYAGRIADLPPAVIAPVDFALAQAALAAGDYDRAEVFACRAVEASRRRATPIFLGRELVRLAAARRRRGAPVSDVDPLVDEARAITASTGARLIDQDAARFGF